MPVENRRISDYLIGVLYTSQPLYDHDDTHSLESDRLADTTSIPLLYIESYSYLPGRELGNKYANDVDTRLDNLQ